MTYFSMPGIVGKNGLTCYQVINEVTEYTGISESILKKKCRKREIVTARQLIIYYLRSYTKMTLKDIGGLFNQDHTTVMHNLSTISDLVCVRNQDIITAIRTIDISLTSKNFQLKRLRILKD